MICPHCKKEIEERPSTTHISEEMDRTKRLAFTGRIAAGVAHEIRNPLTNLSMSVNQLKKLSSFDIPAKHIDIIIRNTGRINDLITELLNCARPPKLALHRYNMHIILENILDSAKIRLQNIEIIKQFTSDPSMIRVDKEQMESALSNMVINAIDAMPKGGELTLATEQDSDFFVIRIQDTGTGIPDGDIMKIYDPFFSSKSDGVGLGLTLCYGIIVSHGGSIEVESKPGEGTIFIVSLPIKKTTSMRNTRF